VTAPRGDNDDFDPARFFHQFPRFVETSETGPWLDRLNARYLALIHANRDRISGARVLDLASHDGRFTFAALQNGAARVVGVEHDPDLVAAARDNLELQGAARERYEFVLGDMFERIPEIEQCDIVFCFGILYHINDHMRLLQTIAEHQPRTLIIDTNISLLPDAVVEVRAPVAGSPPPPGAQLEGADKMEDYRAGRRVTAVVTCNDRITPETRDRAVNLVFERRTDVRTQWLAVIAIAKEFGMSPQALGVWVRRAERLAG
jgi:hypothetical protein